MRGRGELLLAGKQLWFEAGAAAGVQVGVLVPESLTLALISAADLMFTLPHSSRPRSLSP